jgi:hypothetical protein
MESNQRYYARRAIQETIAARTALTPQARERHLMLAEGFSQKAGLGAGLTESLVAA